MRTLKFCLHATLCFATAPQLFSADLVTYLSGPNFCISGSGYSDLPYCTIPGEIPLGSFTVPPAGGTYVDANFGGLVRILTGTPFVHVYSQPTPVSAHNRYIGVRGKDNGRAAILDFQTGQTLWDFLPFSDAWVWDAYDDNIHYRIDGTSIFKTVLSTGVETVLVDYSQTPEHFTRISAGGSTDTSKDNWLAFWAEDQHKVCAVDLNTVHTYCADYFAPEAVSHVGWDWFDYIMV